MARVAVSSSVRVEAPAGVQVTPRAAPVAGAGLAAAAGTPADASPLGQGLAQAGFEVAADFDLRPAAQPTLGAAPAKVRVSVDVKAQENAVLLVESQGGVHAWSFPKSRQPRTLGLGLAPAGGLPAGTLVFEIAPSPAPGAAVGLSVGDLRGSPIWDWVVDKAVGAVRARVLKFVIGKLEKAVVERIEGKLKLGLTSLGKEDPKRWAAGDSSVPALGGANKVLLMVHGTFSSTAGSFSALTACPAGKAFLKTARGATTWSSATTTEPWPTASNRTPRT